MFVRSNTVATLAVTTLAVTVATLTACAAGSGMPPADATTAEAPTAPGSAAAVDPELQRQVVQTYADIAHAGYRDVGTAVGDLDAAIDAFLADPTEASLTAAKATWFAAREVYGPTEVFRFYGGPIDAEDTGPEGRINAWPLDEAYIDYVEGDPGAGIVNKVAEVPDITRDIVVALNEKDGERNVSTGFHAIEFLLWGQDRNADGPGDRPAGDYVVGVGANAERRRQYLGLLSDILVDDVALLVAAWDPERSDNYRAAFLVDDPDAALTKILTGMGSLSGAELAGERLSVPYETKDQEEELSCFSDNTLADLLGNAKGVRMVYMGVYGDYAGFGLSHFVAAADPALAERLGMEIDASIEALRAVPAPFDQQIVADDAAPGRQAILAAIEAVEAQTRSLGDVAALLRGDGNGR